MNQRKSLRKRGFFFVSNFVYLGNILNSMAVLREFKCKQCGYAVVATSTPYVVLPSGIDAQCYCGKCDKIVKVTAGENYQIDVTRLNLSCETCGTPVKVWTPDMGCPKCGGGMKMVESIIHF